MDLHIVSSLYTKHSFNLLDFISVIDFVDRMLDDNPRRRPSMAEALEHPWLVDYEPYHGFAQLEDEEPKATDTDSEETARENEEDAKTLTRAMARAKVQRVKGKGRATGGKVLFYPRHKLIGEGSSGSSLDADTNIPPTPRRRTRRNQSPESPRSVRRSQRTNRGLRRP